MYLATGSIYTSVMMRSTGLLTEAHLGPEAEDRDALQSVYIEHRRQLLTDLRLHRGLNWVAED